MVDIEQYIFTQIATALRQAFPDPEIVVTGDAFSAPSRLPACSIVEMDNTTYQRSLDSEQVENHAVLMYQVDAYSDLETGRKEECRKIQKVVDGEFQKIGFVRTYLSPIPNLLDSGLYRVTSRYRAIVEPSGTTYRRG